MPDWDGVTERRRFVRKENDELIERVAETAVKKAFKCVGIDFEEEESQEALKGLMALAMAFRKTKKSALSEFSKLCGRVIAMLFIYWIAVKLGFLNMLNEIKHIGGN